MGEKKASGNFSLSLLCYRSGPYSAPIKVHRVMETGIMEGNEDSGCVFAPETYNVDFTQFMHPVRVRGSSWETQSVTGIEMITWFK